MASVADMRYAGEVFSGSKAVPAGETELSREDRKRARAGKKRAGRKRTAQKVIQGGLLNHVTHAYNIMLVCVCAGL